MNSGVKSKPSVLVMMATYNGEKYVAEQIDSILAQENVEVTLLISDDGSSDSTPQICAEYSLKFENVIFSVNEKNKGLAKNFMDMLYRTDVLYYDYFAFSDQDDYWLPEKLAKAIGKLNDSGYGPRLYYSDVCNVDENLKGGSLEYGCFAPYSGSMGLLLTINWASGCTMVFNSCFASILQECEPSSWPRYHDGWVHLVARSLNAQVSDLGHSYIRRRISGHNQVGERGLNKISPKRVSVILTAILSPSEHDLTNTASMLLEHYGKYMSNSDRSVVQRFVDGRYSIRKRISMMFDSEFKQPYLLEDVMFKGKMLFNIY